MILLKWAHERPVVVSPLRRFLRRRPQRRRRPIRRSRSRRGGRGGRGGRRPRTSHHRRRRPDVAGGAGPAACAATGSHRPPAATPPPGRPGPGRPSWPGECPTRRQDGRGVVPGRARRRDLRRSRIVVAGRCGDAGQPIARQPLEHEAGAVHLHDRDVVGHREEPTVRHDVMTARRGVGSVDRRRPASVGSTGAGAGAHRPRRPRCRAGKSGVPDPVTGRCAEPPTPIPPRPVAPSQPRPDRGHAREGGALPAMRVDPTTAGDWCAPGREVSRERRRGRAGRRPRRRRPTTRPGRTRQRPAVPPRG